MIRAVRVAAVCLGMLCGGPGSGGAAPAPPSAERAAARRAAGDLRGALGVAEAAAAANPGDGAAWTLAGDYRYALGDRAGALEAYQAAAASGHGGGRVAGLLATLSARPASPLGLRGSAAPLPGASGEATYLAALSAFNAGRVVPATELAAALIAAAPRHWEGWTLLGRCREARGDAAGAREAWHRSLSLHPGQPDVVGWLGPVAAPPPADDVTPGRGIAAASVLPVAGRSAAPPVLPGPVRTGEQAMAAPPPSLRYPAPMPRADAEWPLPESPDRAGVQGPLSAGGGARGGAAGLRFEAGFGVSGPGLGLRRDRISEAYEHGARMVRAAGGTATVESSLAAARATLHLAADVPWRDGWSVTGRIEYAPEAEDWWRADNRFGGAGPRSVSTERRATSLFSVLAGVRRIWTTGGRWEFSSRGALGAVRAWMTVREEDELWWSAAGPPTGSSASYTFGGWGPSGEAVVEASVAFHPLLRAFVEAGGRLAWVPSLSTDWTFDADGDGVSETRRVTERESDGTPVRYDFSAFRAAIGIRFTP